MRYDKAFEREIFVEGVIKMLQALPPTLGETEVAKMKPFLPLALVSHCQQPEPLEPAFVERPADTTALYRLVYNYVIVVFQVLNFFVPLIVSWVGRLLPLEGLTADLKTGHRNGDAYVRRKSEPGEGVAKRTYLPVHSLLGEDSRQVAVYILGGIGHGILDGFGDGLTLIANKYERWMLPAST